MADAPRGPLRRIAVQALLVLAAACAALAVINSFDEEISPEAAAYLSPDKHAVPDARNAYLAMLGIAATGAQPHETGRKQIDAIAAAVAADPLLADMPDVPVENPLKAVGDYAGCRAASSCLQDIARNDGARSFVEANAPLLRRYREIMDYPEFSDAVPPSAFGTFPIYPPLLMQARQLFHADIALRVLQSPETARQALADLARQIQFDRRNLAAAGHSLSKLLFAAFLRDDYLLLSDVLTARNVGAGTGLARSALTPLTGREKSLEHVLRFEGRQNAETLRRVRQAMLRLRHPYADVIATNPELEMRSPFPSGSKAANFLLAWFYQPNAAINEWFHLHKAVVALAGEPVRGRLDAARGEDRWVRDFERDMSPSPFNFAGSITARRLILPGHALRYSFFLDDLDGLVRLVVLKSELLAHGVPSSGVPEYLESRADLSNVYTGSAMRHAFRKSGTGTVLVDLWFDPVNSSWRQRDFGLGAGKVAVTVELSR